MQKSRLLLILMIVAAMVLAACDTGGGDAGSTSGPADVAKVWIEAALSADFETASQHTCSQFADQFGEAPAEAEQVTFDFSGLTYEVTSETDTEATVTISGTLSMTMAEQTQEVSIADMMGDAEGRLIKEDGVWKVCNEQ